MNLKEIGINTRNWLRIGITGEPLWMRHWTFMELFKTLNFILINRPNAHCISNGRMYNVFIFELLFFECETRGFIENAIRNVNCFTLNWRPSFVLQVADLHFECSAISSNDTACLCDDWRYIRDIIALFMTWQAAMCFSWSHSSHGVCVINEKMVWTI